jgi:hypothetical protein
LKDNTEINGNYVINDDMTVDVDIKNKSIKEFEVEFNEVSGDFDCGSCTSLKTLQGAPETVNGKFYCYDCTSLTTLEGAPETVGGYFDCGSCTSLTTLKGAPETVGGYFDCSSCTSLKTLEGVPEIVGGNFYCRHCTSLKSLERIPIEIKGRIYLNGTPFSDLEEELNDNKELLPLYSIGFTKDNYKEPKIQEKLKKLGVEHKVSWSILDDYILDKNIGGSRRIFGKLKKGFF